MTYARSILVPPGSPGTYHCVSRCVRRAWLCGEDRESGRSYEHRRQWVEDRIGELAEIFAVKDNGHPRIRIFLQKSERLSDRQGGPSRLLAATWPSTCYDTQSSTRSPTMR